VPGTGTCSDRSVLRSADLDLAGADAGRIVGCGKTADLPVDMTGASPADV
jgi:hypothetical protein